MDYTTLGRSGLSVSVMGLGCGGPSRLGLATGNTVENAVAVIRRALELGVNVVDTAEAYGTEEAVGIALSEGGRRDNVILSTKVGPRSRDERRTGAEIRERLDGSLARLKTDRVDIYFLHGVGADDYDYCVAELLPTLKELQEAGKVRHVGVTEAFGPDPSHRMMKRAVQDDFWDVVMVGFNLLNPSARETVFPHTLEKGIGTYDMFAVRRALSNPDKLKELMAKLVVDGLISADSFDAADTLGFLTAEGIAATLPEAAYRFCRYEPGMDVILSGTGNIAHLEENASALNQPPLPEEVQTGLRTLFGHIDSVSGN
jgi:L-galactose dehydrogenase